MAVIKNNKTGMWEVRTYYKDMTGERKQKTKRGFTKKSEALEWEWNFKLKENQSISMCFQSFVDIYLTDLEPRIKRNTFLTKKHIIETKILPYFGKRKLDDIRTSDVIQWQNEIMKLKKDNGELFSQTYLKTIHNQLSVILNHTVNMYGLKDNVARKAGTMGKEEHKEMEFWTQEEFQKFLECVADKPISYYAFEMFYWTGIREGELLALLHNIYSIGMALEQEGFKIINNITWQKTNPPPNLACRCFTHSTETILWAKKNDKKSRHFFNYQKMKEMNGGKQMKDVWTGALTKPSEKTEGKHPTQKPEYLLEKIVLASTEEGQAILDPFCGSGTTGVEAVRFGRKFIGIDVSEEYLEISKKRLKKVANDK